MQVVFPHDRAYTPYKPIYKGKPVDVGGVFYSGRDANYITLISDPTDERLRELGRLHAGHVHQRRGLLGRTGLRPESVPARRGGLLLALPLRATAARTPSRAACSRPRAPRS